MSIFAASAPGQKHDICARCGRRFRPRKEGDRYGPTCSRKLAGQVELDSMALVSGKVLKL